MRCSKVDSGDVSRRRSVFAVHAGEDEVFVLPRSGFVNAAAIRACYSTHLSMAMTSATGASS